MLWKQSQRVLTVNAVYQRVRVHFFYVEDFSLECEGNCKGMPLALVPAGLLHLGAVVGADASTQVG